MTALEFHPLANLFPLIEGKDFDQLVEGIRADGFRAGEEIILFEGKILDGRNRYRALCRLVEEGAFPPETIEQSSWLFAQFDSETIDGIFSEAEVARGPLAFVIAKNLHRRQLTDDQRRMVAARIANLPKGAHPANGGMTQQQAAETLAVDPAGVERAKAVVTHGAEELQHAVEHGDVTVRAAADIAKLPKDEQKALLIKVAESPDGKRALKQAAKEIRAKDQASGHVVRQEIAERLNAKNPDLPAGRTFNLVLIDIPRKHRVHSDETGSEKAPDNHYPTMTFEETLAFPIDRFAAKDCIIAYWSTAASLIDDIDILAEWGFIALRPRDGLGRLVRPNDEPLPPLKHRGSYGSHQIWRKIRSGKQTGMGRWFRDQHELLIVARRGHLPAPLPGSQAESVFDAAVTEHSTKPNEETFAWIDRCWPYLSKVYVFARGDAPKGWTFWGNQVPPLTVDGEKFNPDTGEIEDRPAGVPAVEAASDARAGDESASLDSRSESEAGQTPEHGDGQAAGSGFVSRAENEAAAGASLSPDLPAAAPGDESPPAPLSDAERAHLLGTMPKDDDLPEIPDFLKRDRDNRAPFMRER